ncbi:PrpF domain-containing protein [Halomarina oriensis]|uniref:PrpF protein n=1 Tax=Halomarina oriensis TaxID=671145 RepID=A0A6B0GSC2_9EURY|nr:PrpF domain-containing protein [Halomarina oriensis]MWG34995.1 hypothetical protein [Halomarina oriensis]
MTADDSRRPGVPAALVRGGTSKGGYFERDDLPDDRKRCGSLLSRLFGSPDPMQLDGVGGSHSTTSKAMVVAAGEGATDVEYTFAQVGIERPVVDWGGNCGNLTFGVGPFALERGLVTPKAVDEQASADERRVTLRLENTNTGTRVEQSVPLGPSGQPEYAGTFDVAGLPRSGARIRSRFLDPAGAMTDALFPTGHRTDVLDVPDFGAVEVSLVDVSNPCVFVRASDVGCTAAERPTEIDADADLLARLERIRSAACERLGIVADAADATAESPGVPKLAVVGERRTYETVDGDRITPDEYDLLARILSMGTAHHAYAVTGAMCTAAAAVLDGTIPSEFLAEGATDAVTIAHPKGTLRVGVNRDGEAIAATTVDRTARVLMNGRLYDPKA